MNLLKSVVSATSNQVSSQTKRLRIKDSVYEQKEKISEGGFSFVYLAKDTNTGKCVALKRVLCHDKPSFNAAVKETQILENLPPHKNIVKFYGSVVKDMKDSDGTLRTKEVVIALELCPGGHLINLIEKFDGRVPAPEIIKVLKDITECMHHLHSQSPEIVHADIKVENVLLGDGGVWKVCDFGSCIEGRLATASMGASEIGALEEGISKRTTMMYRPPELVDLYLRLEISYKIDIWMLGCVLFSLAFGRHPFQDVSQIAIVNAYFELPPNSLKILPEFLFDLMFWMLAPTPDDRPDTNQIKQVLDTQKCPELPRSVSKQKKTILGRSQERKETEDRLKHSIENPNSIQKPNSLLNLSESSAPPNSIVKESEKEKHEKKSKKTSKKAAKMNEDPFFAGNSDPFMDSTDPFSETKEMDFVNPKTESNPETGLDEFLQADPFSSAEPEGATALTVPVISDTWATFSAGSSSVNTASSSAFRRGLNQADFFSEVDFTVEPKEAELPNGPVTAEGPDQNDPFGSLNFSADLSNGDHGAA